MAKQLQDMGRGDDSVLVHMTPNEVNSLQGLAMASGGSLTTNPHTGLPEAGWLGKLLPTLLGGVLAATGVGAPLAAGIVGLGQTALTGDLRKGLMAGLGAFGGASLAGAAGLGGELSSNAFGALGDKAGILGANMGAGAATAIPSVAPTIAAPAGMGNVTAPVFGGAITPASAAATGQAALANSAAQTGANGAGFFSKFGDAAKAGLPKGIIANAAPMLAASGVLNTVSQVATPDMPKYDPSKEKSNYKGPYLPSPRQVSAPRPYDPYNMDSSEAMYFTPSNPVPGYRPSSEVTEQERSVYGLAEGGTAKAPSKDAGFNDLVSYFQSSSPGPVTASMYPVQSAAPMKEEAHAFKTPPVSTSTGAGFSGGVINIPGYGPIDLSKYVTAPTPTPTPTPATKTPATPTPTTPYEYYSRYGGAGGDRTKRVEVATGGKINMNDGSFVVDARTVSELGNGSSNAGIELLSRMGGHPVRGAGDGVSDSVPARIGGKQEARVARDEVIFSSEAVRRVGGGDEKRGTKKLYALMDKAHKARKRAGRGTDTHLRRGLA